MSSGHQTGDWDAPRERAAEHIPVMPAEALQYLAPRPGGFYVDGTAGLGGHARAIAAQLGRDGVLLCLDKDPEALERAAPHLRPHPDESGRWPRIELRQASFAELSGIMRELARGPADGLLLDLGVSSLQLSAPDRGFSFLADGPLDMRMDPRQPLTAEQVVNQSGERELADWIYQFGEERRSRRIARAIVRARPLHSTRQLADVIAAAARPMKSSRHPAGKSGKLLHPATRTFQALRILVNSELDDLAVCLRDLPANLRSGGRAVVIAFHSLEDRPVKEAFRAGAQAGHWRLLTPHVVRPAPGEIACNPRARSARLRAVERLE